MYSKNSILFFEMELMFLRIQYFQTPPGIGDANVRSFRPGWISFKNFVLNKKIELVVMFFESDDNLTFCVIAHAIFKCVLNKRN